VTEYEKYETELRWLEKQQRKADRWLYIFSFGIIIMVLHLLW
jgi:alpha/beta superfamily hydrolase